MVAFGRLLEHLEMGVELLFGWKRRAVDAGQLLVLLATLPIGAGNGKQAERAELAGIRDMRAQAEVDEIAGPIEARRSVCDLVLDQLDLEWLVQPLEEGGRLGPGHLLLHEGRCRFDDLAHPRLDLRQILGLESLSETEVVVEALVGGGTDADHRPREEFEHRRGHHVRGGMAEDFQIFAHGCSPKRVSRLYGGYWKTLKRRGDVGGRPGCRPGQTFARRATPRCRDGPGR